MTGHDNWPNGSTAERITLGIARLGLAMRQQSWQQAGGRGLTPTQGQVLSQLAGQAEPQRLGQLVEALALTAATVSECVQVLAEKGLVKKFRDPQDGRALRLSLSPAGRREAQRAGKWGSFLAEAMDTLSADEQAVLLRAMSKVIRQLELEDQLPQQRMCLNCSHFRIGRLKGRRQEQRCELLQMPLTDATLQLDCPSHRPAEQQLADENWQAFRR